MEILGPGGVITDDFKLTRAPAPGYVLVSDSAGVGTWASIPATVARMLSYSFSDTGYPYIQTTQSTWAAVSKVIFPGTDMVQIANALFSAHLGGGTSGDIRIVRADTGQVICSYTGLTAVTTTLYAMSAPTNLPATPTIFEIQLQAIGPAGKTRLSSILLY